MLRPTQTCEISTTSSPHLPHFPHIINVYLSPKTHPDNDDDDTDDNHPVATKPFFANDIAAAAIFPSTHHHLRQNAPPQIAQLQLGTHGWTKRNAV